MVWKDGIPTQGLSGLGWQGRGEYPITYCSQGNEKIVLFVEMACNGLFGAGYPVPHDPPNMNKYYTLKQVEIGLFDKKKFEMITNFNLISEIARV
jgi:alpha-mannosidase